MDGASIPRIESQHLRELDSDVIDRVQADVWTRSRSTRIFDGADIIPLEPGEIEVLRQVERLTGPRAGTPPPSAVERLGSVTVLDRSRFDVEPPAVRVNGALVAAD